MTPERSQAQQLIARAGDRLRELGLSESLDRGARVVAGGAVGSSVSVVCAWLAIAISRPILIVSGHVDEAEDIASDLATLGAAHLAVLPAIETLPGETHASFEHFSARVSVVRELATGSLDRSGILVAPIHALMQPVPEPDALSGLVRRIASGMTLEPAELLDWLDRARYTRRDAVDEPGDVAVRGGIIDIFPAGGAAPIRLDLFGDEVEKLTEVDPETMASDRAIPHAELVMNDPSVAQSREGVAPAGLLPEGIGVVLVEPLEIAEQGRGYYERLYDAGGVLDPRRVIASLASPGRGVLELSRDPGQTAAGDVRADLPFDAVPELPSDVSGAVSELGRIVERGGHVVVACQNDGETRRFDEIARELSAEPAPGLVVEQLPLTHGFVIESDREQGEASQPTVVVPYHELLRRPPPRRVSRALRTGRATDAFMEFGVGDYVVHTDHGIARFAGLELIAPKKRPGQVGQGEPEEYLTLEFAGRRRLHVPAVQIDRVQRYVGGRRSAPTLSTLGGVKWKHQKQRVTESVRDLAAELLRVRAARESMTGVRFPEDTVWQAEFEAEFPYEETEDQLAALAAIKRDMVSTRPMDRLVCGDVGFGKTELAIRAAFKACEAGKQVAVLVPTTVLAEQHERTFRERFADYPFTVESVSRFKTGARIADVLERVEAGTVDVVIGTHRLLSGDVSFADLGLLVIDEEQRFGVEHKDALLRFRLTVDVLTLTATPIPRTLHMAMLGIRDISSLTTAPADRRAVVTELVPFTERRISRAIARELSRGGQVYYLHNRVKSIHAAADRVRALAPGARVEIGHGQMAPGELEEVMLRFVRREIDVLVCTTIIESGIDIPTANTIVIADAHRFGLAELHQLRGRVGRSSHRAYCYLLEPETGALSDVAKKRLAAVEQYSMLGAGFKIAMRDLEIRGAGNLLGPEQSGHIAAVGYDMYCRLLDNAVRQLRNERVDEPPSIVSVELGPSGQIPRAYIPSDRRRLEAYRRLATAESCDQLDTFERDLTEAYGPVPRGVARLIELARIKIHASSLGVRAIARIEQDLVFTARDPGPLTRAVGRARGTVRVVARQGDPELKEVYYRPPSSYLDQQTILGMVAHLLAGQPDPGSGAPRAPSSPAEA